MAKRELALECDYRYELDAQRRFKALIGGDPYTAAHFAVPGVIPELSAERVLTTEWVPGVHIDKVGLCIVEWGLGVFWAGRMIRQQAAFGA